MRENTGDPGIAKRIKELREHHKLSQKELGDKIDKTPSMVGHYEKGSRGVPLDTLRELCKIFDVSMNYLLEGKEDETVIDIFKDDLPEELQGLKIEYLQLSKELQDKKISPEKVRRIIEIIDMNNDKTKR